jgi:LemA protein
MGGGWILLLAVLVLAAISALSLISIYNRLVALKNRFENAFSQISVQLKRRHDLIPNIVETAKGYLKHEGDTFQKVVAARNEAAALLKGANPGDASSMEALNRAESNLSASFRGIRLQMEAYPELKADAVMLQLSEELVATENRVAFARQAFNDSATEYNIQRNRFPANLFAATFGHAKDASLLSFEDEKAIQQAPKVSF